MVLTLLNKTLYIIYVQFLVFRGFSGTKASDELGRTLCAFRELAQSMPCQHQLRWQDHPLYETIFEWVELPSGARFGQTTRRSKCQAPLHGRQTLYLEVTLNVSVIWCFMYLGKHIILNKNIIWQPFWKIRNERPLWFIFFKHGRQTFFFFFWP